MAVQLSASYLRRSFQLLAQVASNGVSAEAAFERAADLVYAWGRRKYVKIFRDMPEEKASFDENQNANELGVLYDREAGRFFFRAAHSDTQVPGRIWITDVELLRQENGKPYLRLQERAKMTAEKAGFTVFSVSVTHTREYAAVAVLAYEG